MTIPPTASLIPYPPRWRMPFRVDRQYSHHFSNDAGDFLFVLNKTAWTYFGCDAPEAVVAKAHAQGITVLRVALEGTPYPDALHIDLWPWGGTRAQPEWTSMNAAYWDEVERRIALAGQKGVGLNLVLYFTLHPAAEHIDAHRLYWEIACRRLSRHANLFAWEIANEYTANEGFQDAAGQYFRDHDPWQRPVFSSAGTTDGPLWPNKEWMSVALIHTCTGSHDAYDLRDWYWATAMNTRQFGKPAFNNESGRERRHRNDDPVHRRKQSWIWCACGGYWTWHSWEGCEGIDDAGYFGPAAEFLAPLANFFQSIPFWTLAPNFTVIQPADTTNLVACVLASWDRDLVVGYLCTRTSGALMRGTVRVRLPAGDYVLTYRSPSTFRILDIQLLTSTSLGDTQSRTLPHSKDDLLIEIHRQTPHVQERISGTT